MFYLFLLINDLISIRIVLYSLIFNSVVSKKSYCKLISFKLINYFRPCANILAPSSPNELFLNFINKMYLAKDFIRNPSLFFHYLSFREGSFFYSKFNVRLFKLIKDFSPCANSLAPSSPMELFLNFCYK